MWQTAWYLRLLRSVVQTNNHPYKYVSHTDVLEKYHLMLLETRWHGCTKCIVWKVYTHPLHLKEQKFHASNIGDPSRAMRDITSIVSTSAGWKPSFRSILRSLPCIDIEQRTLQQHLGHLNTRYILHIRTASVQFLSSKSSRLTTKFLMKVYLPWSRFALSANSPTNAMYHGNTGVFDRVCPRWFTCTSVWG